MSGTKKIPLVLTVVALLLYGAFAVFADAPSGGYDPGATLDPDCNPGDTVPEPCIVKLPVGWLLTGNAGTDGGVTNFIGTTDAQDFVIKVNGNEMGRFYKDTGASAYSVALGGGFAPAAVMFVAGVGAGYNATNAIAANFIGYAAGEGATNAVASNFIGGETGKGATSASSSNFFGGQAGFNAVNASSSNFFGAQAGYLATNAQSSNFIGSNAGNAATDAEFSNFIGSGAGQGATFAEVSNFMGRDAGKGATNASHSNFFGRQAGFEATGAYDSNFFGSEAGYQAVDAYSSSFFGTAAGSGAINAHMSNFFGLNAGFQATDAIESNFFGASAGVFAADANNSNFFGSGAGASAINAAHSVFFGRDTGAGATNADHSIFMGAGAGNGATDADHSNFIGYQAGLGASTAFSSNFFGNAAGNFAANANNSNFFGSGAGENATNASNSFFVGHQAGHHAINAANSIFLGENAGYYDTVDNTAPYNDTSTFADTSILIGHKTSTGGFENSIAIGAYATNSASNEFMIGSSTRPINTLVLTGASGNTCTLDVTVASPSCSSDERLKTNVTDLSGSTLASLLNVRTVSYNWVNYPDKGRQIGFLAQDLQNYFPEIVSEAPNGFKTVSYGGMTPILVEAIREMNLKVTDLQNNEKPNTWRDALIAWFGSATNGITHLFSKKVTTEELCLKDTGGETCYTRGQLNSFLQNQGSGQIILPQDPTPPDPTNQPDPNTVTQPPDDTQQPETPPAQPEIPTDSGLPEAPVTQ